MQNEMAKIINKIALPIQNLMHRIAINFKTSL